MRWFLIEENKSAIYHIKSIMLFQNLNLVLYPFFCKFFLIVNRSSNMNSSKMATYNGYYYILYNKINYAFFHLTKYTNFW